MKHWLKFHYRAELKISGSYGRICNGVLLPVIQHGFKVKDVIIGEALLSRL